jgi:hypothetical protein
MWPMINHSGLFHNWKYKLWYNIYLIIAIFVCDMKYDFVVGFDPLMYNIYAMPTHLE